MANGETGFGTIKCPACGEAIPIGAVIQHQIAKRTRQESEAAALEARRVLQAKEDELNRMTASLDQTISERLAAERDNLIRELEARYLDTARRLEEERVRLQQEVSTHREEDHARRRGF